MNFFFVCNMFYLEAIRIHSWRQHWAQASKLAFFENVEEYSQPLCHKCFLGYFRRYSGISTAPQIVSSECQFTKKRRNAKRLMYKGLRMREGQSLRPENRKSQAETELVEFWAFSET